MRKILLTTLAMMLCIFDPIYAQEDSAEWDNSTDAADGEIFSFVGRKIFLNEKAKNQTMDVKLPDGRVITRTLPAFDTRYEGRYEILNVVQGNHEGPTIDFENYDHYGRPHFPKFETVLLFMQSYKGGWVKSKRTYFPVSRTTDGDWAVCGNAAYGRDDKYVEIADSFVEPLGFIDPIKLEDGQHCTSGIRSRNLFNLRELTRFGPQRRRVACNREMGEPDYIHVGSGSLPGAEKKKRIHEACVARLEIEDGL